MVINDFFHKQDWKYIKKKEKTYVCKTHYFSWNTNVSNARVQNAVLILPTVEELYLNLV